MPQRQPLDPAAVKVLHRAWEQQNLPQDVLDRLAALMPDELPPSPQRPALFQPEPFVNNPTAQQMLHDILRAAPEIQRHLGHVTVGPTGDTLDVLSGTRFNVNDYDR